MAKYVIDIDEDNLDNNDIYCIVANAISLEKVLADLPITPTRKKGKWTNGDPICPCCGEDKFKDLDADIWADWQPKYCPNCGAEMESEE